MQDILVHLEHSAILCYKNAGLFYVVYIVPLYLC